MSMTREEAIEVLENGGWWDSLIPVTTIEGRIEDDKLQEALNLAISSLRPVSREQVEKVWKGEWMPYLDGEHIMPERYYRCSKCGDRGYMRKRNFCPHCGAPMADEAVGMVMERLEALKNADTNY